MNPKKIILTLIWMLATGLAGIHAQQAAFEVLLPYSVDYSASFCAETNDGHFLVVPGKNMILKLSQQGEVVDEMEYTIEGTEGSEYASTRFCALLDIPDDPSHHIAIAESYESSPSGTTSNILHIFKFDDNLLYDSNNIIVVDLSEKVRNYASLFNARFILEEDGSVCFASNAQKWDDSMCLMFVRVTADGNITVSFNEHFSDYFMLQVCDFTPKNGHYNMVLGYNQTYKGVHYLSFCEVNHEFDFTLVYHLSNVAQSETLLQYDNLTDSLFMALWLQNDNCATNWLNDSVFLLPTEIMGCSHYNWNTFYGAGIWKLDTSFNIIKYVFFDVYDAPDPNHVYKLLDARNPIVINNDEVYFCYTTNSGYVGDPQQTAICKLDTDLNLIWKRWYGGAKEYHNIFDFIPTSDGGCLLSGKGAADPHDYNNSSPYVLKINSEGYCSVNENGEPALKPFALRTNPVSDILHLEFSPDVRPESVELYDVQGRLLSTQSSDLENISVEGLTAGIYTMRVVMKDGSSFSDKVVKQ